MYIKKTIYLPHRIEVEKYHTGRYGSKKRPAKREKPTSEEMAKVNERRRIKKLYYLLAMNFGFGDLHMQLTYRPNERPTPKEAKEHLKVFMRNLRKEFKKRGRKLKYIITTEYERTAIHHHIVINEVGETAKLVNDLWEKGKAFFSVIYKNGEVEDLAAYLIKETQKSFRKPENPNKLSYTRSRNLKLPKEKIEIIRADSWKENPKAPKGYYIQNVSEGINKFGYPYQSYTCIKEEQSENQNRKRKARDNTRPDEGDQANGS